MNGVYKYLMVANLLLISVSASGSGLGKAMEKRVVKVGSSQNSPTEIAAVKTIQPAPSGTAPLSDNTYEKELRDDLMELKDFRNEKFFRQYKTRFASQCSTQPESAKNQVADQNNLVGMMQSSPGDPNASVSQDIVPSVDITLAMQSLSRQGEEKHETTDQNDLSQADSLLIGAYQRNTRYEEVLLEEVSSTTTQTTDSVVLDALVDQEMMQASTDIQSDVDLAPNDFQCSLVPVHEAAGVFGGYAGSIQNNGDTTLSITSHSRLLINEEEEEEQESEGSSANQLGLNNMDLVQDKEDDVQELNQRMTLTQNIIQDLYLERDIEALEYYKNWRSSNVLHLDIATLDTYLTQNSSASLKELRDYDIDINIPLVKCMLFIDQRTRQITKRDPYAQHKNNVVRTQDSLLILQRLLNDMEEDRKLDLYPLVNGRFGGILYSLLDRALSPQNYIKRVKNARARVERRVDREVKEELRKKLCKRWDKIDDTAIKLRGELDSDNEMLKSYIGSRFYVPEPASNHLAELQLYLGLTWGRKTG